MWDTTAPDPQAFDSQWAIKVEIRGIPHLAKNERDVGHPRSVADPDTYGLSPYSSHHWANRRKKLVDFHSGRWSASATRNASFSRIELNCAAAARSTGWFKSSAGA